MAQSCTLCRGPSPSVHMKLLNHRETCTRLGGALHMSEEEVEFLNSVLVTWATLYTVFIYIPVGHYSFLKFYHNPTLASKTYISFNVSPSITS